jgi:gamma-glutamylcysteine synthetase
MTSQALDSIFAHFSDGFSRAMRGPGERRIGAELKFPFVDARGLAVARRTVDALWDHLLACGWRPEHDPAGGRTVGARKAGEQNDTVFSYETGYCKPEISLAHAGDLFALQETLDGIVADLRPFVEREDAVMLCYGMQPVTSPSAELLARKSRAGFWDKALPSNNVIPASRGDDVHLFTVNACSHVHVGMPRGDAVRLVNVLNGMAGAQIALTANSASLAGWVKDDYKCVNEKLWDWWEPVKERVGVPPAPFADLRDYVDRISALPPIYVKRDGQPVILCRDYARFSDYFGEREALGRSVSGRPYRVTPASEDIAVHNSCYWYTARISRYFTVENRVFDQQPHDALLAPAALTLGLACALDEAEDALERYDWNALRMLRETACRHGMDPPSNGMEPAALAARMLEIAALGLRRRDRGEDAFLAPLQDRMRTRCCPADAARAIPRGDWPHVLVAREAL